MKILKIIKKYWLKILCVTLICAISFYVLCFGLKKATNYEILKGDNKQQTIYTIWHIETFEGGGKARIDYLKTIARNMEKEDNQVLFMIKSVAPEKLTSELEVSLPDIISFGFGVGELVLPHLIPQENTFNVRDELILSGSFNRKLYAVPYMVSGYAWFFHTMQASEFHVGTNNYTAPENIYNPLNFQPTETETQYEAYKDFVYNKKVNLLGTERDLFRISNLNSIGRTNAMITPIDTYTDLIQYLGIINSNKITQKFLSLALSDSYQNTLVNYSLFSSKYNKLYSSGIYNDMEDAIMSCEIPSVFVAPQHF
ncbi:MAG: hypothetical protein J6Q13_00765 [Clostridia bacterium]|nr:hypothetical protein [Clostridia bacterium]